MSRAHVYLTTHIYEIFPTTHAFWCQKHRSFRKIEFEKGHRWGVGGYLLNHGIPTACFAIFFGFGQPCCIYIYIARSKSPLHTSFVPRNVFHTSQDSRKNQTHTNDDKGWETLIATSYLNEKKNINGAVGGCTCVNEGREKLRKIPFCAIIKNICIQSVDFRLYMCFKAPRNN